MAADQRPEIIVEELPGGGKRWRLAEMPAYRQAPSEDAFKHRVGVGHNLIRLFELFVAAWENHCEEQKDGSLLIPSRESASELHANSLEVDARIGHELMRLPNSRGGGIYYDDLSGADRHILNACLTMSKGLRELPHKTEPFIVGTRLSSEARKALHRSVRILANWFSAEEDEVVASVGPAVNTSGLESTGSSNEGGNPNTAPQHIFKRDGKTWTIKYGEQGTTLPHRIGLEYIRRLLAQPGEWIRAEVLESPINASVAMSAPSEAVIDREARRKLEARLQDLRDERSAIREEGEDLGASSDQREQEIADIEEELRRTRALGGRQRRLGDPHEKARGRVANAIEKAMAVLEEEVPILGQHLRKALKSPTGRAPRYAPDQQIAWDVGANVSPTMRDSD